MAMAALYDSAAGTLPRYKPTEEDVLTINFVEDGVAAFGKVWLRGEELSVKRGSPSWEATCDRDGNSWMELTDREQYARWGEVRFREGLWAGRSLAELAEIDDPALTDEDKKVLEKAAAEQAALLNEHEDPKPAKKASKKTAAKKTTPKAPEPVPEAVEAVSEDAEGESDDAEDSSGDGDPFLNELNKD